MKPAREPLAVDAVIFDFDETIIDLEPQHAAAHAALCRDLGADYDSLPESFRTSSGRRIIDDIREMRSYFGWSAGDEELLARRQAHFDAVCREAALVPMGGVRETIRALHAKQIPLAITSSAVRSSIDAILERLRLRDAFSLIVDGSEVQHGKPDPEAYLVTASKLRADAAGCVVFEDSHVGVLAAKGAGMYCIAVRNPRAQTWQDLTSADVIVDAMSDVDVTSWRRRC